jgi:hypothetical protein
VGRAQDWGDSRGLQGTPGEGLGNKLRGGSHPILRSRAPSPVMKMAGTGSLMVSNDRRWIDRRRDTGSVSRMSPRLGGTPGDCRGLQGKDSATNCAAGRARSLEVACHHQLEKALERIRLPPPPPFDPGAPRVRSSPDRSSSWVPTRAPPTQRQAAAGPVMTHARPVTRQRVSQPKRPRPYRRLENARPSTPATAAARATRLRPPDRRRDRN